MIFVFSPYLLILFDFEVESRPERRWERMSCTFYTYSMYQIPYFKIDITNDEEFLGLLENCYWTSENFKMRVWIIDVDFLTPIMISTVFSWPFATLLSCKQMLKDDVVSM